MRKHNWTEPRTYTDPDGRPYSISIYSHDDGREIARIGISKDDDAESIAQIKAEFALIAGAPGLGKAARKMVKAWDEPTSESIRIMADAITALRDALADAGVQI